jgi:SNF2 family DNA or RNA helicase
MVCLNVLIPVSNLCSEVSAKGLKHTLMQLRKVCNHPYLFDDEGAWTEKPTSDVCFSCHVFHVC